MTRNRTWILWLAGFGILVAFLLGLGIGYRFKSNPSNAESISSSAIDQDQIVVMAALAYGQSGDLDRAIARLDMIGASSDGQSVADVAERSLAAGHNPSDIAALAVLARDLGADETTLLPHLPTSIPSPVPPTNTPQSLPPTATAIPVIATPEPSPTIESSTPTPLAPTATSIPDTATPTQTLVPTQTSTPAPAVTTGSAINVRGGPGVAYAVVGSLHSGGSMTITGRNQNDGWWQIDQGDGDLGWVSAQVVDVNGDTSAVPVITDIAPPPATPTPSSPPTPTAPPNPDVGYVIKSVRLRAIGEHSQRCDSGDHNIYVTVVDAMGNRLDGVLVREVYTGATHATGSQGKGSGNAEWDIYRGGGGAMVVVDESGNRLSEVTRDMSADWPAFDMLTAAGYCNCKPHPDDASCKADLESKRFFFAVGHYVYEVIFQRSY